MQQNLKDKARNSDLNHDLEKLKALLKETTNDVGAFINHSVEDAKDKTVEMKGEVSEYFTDKITSKPFAAVGLAMMTGWLFGVWMRKKPRK